MGTTQAWVELGQCSGSIRWSALLLALGCGASCSGTRVEGEQGSAGTAGVVAGEGGAGAQPPIVGMAGESPGSSGEGGAAGTLAVGGKPGMAGEGGEGGDGFTSDDPTALTGSSGCGSIRLAIQGSTLYWSERLSGKIKAMPVAGGKVTLVASGQLEPTQIVSDEDGVYWINQGDGSVSSSRLAVKTLPLQPGDPELLAVSGSATAYGGLALHAGMLYVSLGHDVHAMATDGNSGGADVVATATNYDLDPPSVQGVPAGLVADDTLVAWTDSVRFGIEADAPGPGNSDYVRITQSQGNLLLSDIALDSEYVYWVNFSLVRDKRSGLASGETSAPEFLANAPELDLITAFAINGSAAFFASDLGGIWTHSLLPSEYDVLATSVAQGQMGVTSLVLDSTHVYWATGDCVIHRTAF